MFLTRIVCGVPKWKTPKPKKQTRKFSYTRILQLEENLVRCGSCSNVHRVTTICLNCYENVRVETNELKRQLMKYNPYIGERQKPCNEMERKNLILKK